MTAFCLGKCLAGQLRPVADAWQLCVKGCFALVCQLINGALCRNRGCWFCSAILYPTTLEVSSGLFFRPVLHSIDVYPDVVGEGLGLQSL
mmetsp:Transcript_30686/g.64618  ORF Transcript_30686/g.64618 Transcript_30686/m.64618 type:complete len:90 (+) Transcript_30686:967-1236(+)